MIGVSYIVTVYNKAPYLEGVLAGLAGQSGDFAREFIFVDDGSTDDSVALLEQLTSGWKNVKIIRQANKGPSAALNTAADAAQYDILKSVDADDILTPSSTVWLLDALHRHNAVLAYGDGGTYNLGETPVMPTPGAPPTIRVIDDPMTRLLRNSFVSPSYMMVPTARYREVGGCVEYVIPQDYSLQLKLARYGPFAHVAAPVALMPREAPGRLSDAPARTLHDINLLLYETLRDDPDLTPRQRRLAIRRATGRAMRFRRRFPNSAPLWRSWLRYLAARVPLGPMDERFIIHGLYDFGVPSQIDGFHPYPNCVSNPEPGP